MTDESSWTSPSAPGGRDAPTPPPPHAPQTPPAAGQAPPPPPPPQAGWQPPGTGWQQAPPVHKPGIVALRPLRLGDMYDGAFAAIRQNPRAMIGMAAVVMTWFLLLPTLVSVALAAAGNLQGPFDSDDFAPPPPGAEPEPTTFPASMLLGYAGQLLAAFAVLVVTGLVVHVVAQAVLGRRVASGEAWSAVRGRVLPLIGLTFLGWLVAFVPLLLVVALAVLLGVTVHPAAGLLVGLPLGLLAFLGMVWFYVRYVVLAPAALVLERMGVVASMRRAAALTRGQFWRVLGIVVLTQVIAGVASSMLSMPFSLAGVFGFLVVPDSWTGLVYVLGTYLGMLVSYSLATPFTAAVTVLQYVDQRIRKEAFDVQLIAETSAR